MSKEIKIEQCRYNALQAYYAKERRDLGGYTHYIGLLNQHYHTCSEEEKGVVAAFLSKHDLPIPQMNSEDNN